MMQLFHKQSLLQKTQKRINQEDVTNKIVQHSNTTKP